MPENLFWNVADILQHVSSKVLDTDCSWYFMVLYLYLGKVLIMFLVRYYISWQKFVSCLWLDHSNSEAIIS